MATARRPLLVPVADLLQRAGNRKPVRGEVTLGRLEVVGSASLDDPPVLVEIELEALHDGSVVATGTVAFSWEGECRRCLEVVRGRAEVAVREVFAERAIDEDTWPIEGEQLDLGPVVRDAVLLELPLAPLCREECPGPAGAADRVVVGDGGDEAPLDPRWAALRELRNDA